jgi:chromosome segregation ATPase
MNAELRISKLVTESDQNKVNIEKTNKLIQDMEIDIQLKEKKIEELLKDLEQHKTSTEEQIVYLQIQLNTNKTKDENKDKELLSLKKQLDLKTSQISALQNSNEEKDMSVKSNKEMIQALQSRLIELEPELAHTKDKLKEYERNTSVHAMMKAEHDALLHNLKKDLKSSFDENEELLKKISELNEFKLKAEAQSAVVGGTRHAGPGGGFLGDHGDARKACVAKLVAAFEKIDGFEILPAPEEIRQPLPLPTRVVEIQHRRDGIHA